MVLLHLKEGKGGRFARLFSFYSDIVFKEIRKIILTRASPTTKLSGLERAIGSLAQLGERLHGMEEVMGSSPTRSTKIKE